METFEKKQIIKGVSFFDGVIDGKEIRSGVVFIEHQLDESKGNAKGFRTVELKADCEAVKMVINQDYPLNANVLYEMRVSKGSHTMTIVRIDPLSKAAGMPHDKKAA
jgi:hypothetical protein